MSPSSRLALRRAQRTGVWICVLSVLVAVTFVIGLAQHSYWALALPVAVGVLGACALAFWIGYTVNTVRGIPAEADHYEGAHARRMALGICALSIAAAVAFLLGVVRQSYWALAVPVGVVVLGLLGMVFWIGWAIVTQRTTLPQPEADDRPAPDDAPPAEPEAAPQTTRSPAAPEAPAPGSDGGTPPPGDGDGTPAPADGNSGSKTSARSRGNSRSASGSRSRSKAASKPRSRSGDKAGAKAGGEADATNAEHQS